jgi:hypothetical protein
MPVVVRATSVHLHTRPSNVMNSRPFNRPNCTLVPPAGGTSSQHTASVTIKSGLAASFCDRFGQTGIQPRRDMHAISTGPFKILLDSCTLVRYKAANIESCVSTRPARRAFSSIASARSRACCKRSTNPARAKLAKRSQKGKSSARGLVCHCILQCAVRLNRACVTATSQARPLATSLEKRKRRRSRPRTLHPIIVYNAQCA